MRSSPIGPKKPDGHGSGQIHRHTKFTAEQKMRFGEISIFAKSILEDTSENVESCLGSQMVIPRSNEEAKSRKELKSEAKQYSRFAKKALEEGFVEQAESIDLGRKTPF